MKNIKKQTIVGIGIILLIFSIPSCKKLLDKKPLGNVFDASYWKTQGDATAALAGAYSQLRTEFLGKNYNMAYNNYGDLTSGIYKKWDDYALNSLTGWDENDQNINAYKGAYLEPLHNWSGFYKPINYLNTILYKVPSMPNEVFNSQQDKNEIIGQALFLRSFIYFYMVRIWGDLPLVRTYTEDPVSSPNIKRTSELLILDSCIVDLDKAIKLLKWQSPTYINNIRANKGAILALKAHIYMWKDFLTNNADNTNLTKAIKAIDSIETSGMYSLLPANSFPQLYKGGSQEGIYEIAQSFENKEFQMATGFSYSHLNNNYIPQKTSHNGYFNLNKLYNDESQGAVYKGLYKFEDARFIANFDASNYNDPIFLKFVGKNRENLLFQNPQNPTSNTAIVNANIIVFRLADMILLRAEANAKLGNLSSALTDLNKIRERASIDDFSSTDADELKKEIVYERFRELIGEGHNYFDLIRNNMLYDWFDGRFSQERINKQGWKWPVGQELFLNNPVLVQNLYWIGREY